MPQWATGADGCLIEFDDLSGFKLLYFMDRPNVMEIRAFDRSQSFRISFSEEQGIGFFCFKVGKLPWSDCVFSPHLYDRKPQMPPLEPGKGYALNLLHINSHTGELLSIRLLGLGHEFSCAFREWCLKNLERNMTPEEYQAAVRTVFQQFSTEDLAKKALFSWEINA